LTVIKLKNLLLNCPISGGGYTSIETTTVGNGEEQTLSSKQYNNEGGLKQEIKVQVTKNTGDSTVVDYDTVPTPY